MSLINDALRKARQEAAEREAEERGVSYRPPRAHLPERSRMGLGVILGLVLGFLGAFAGAYVLLRPSTPAPATVAEVAPPAASETASLLESSPVSGEPGPPSLAPGEASEPEADGANIRSIEPASGRPEAVSEASAAAEVVSVEPPRTIPPPVPPRSVDPPPARPQASPEAPTASLPAAPAASMPAPVSEDLPRIQPPDRVGQVDDTNEFVLEADLGDVRLILDFIVWVPGRPFAQINGSQVEEGQMVEGLLVEKIERDRVTLGGQNGRLVLRVR